MYVSLKRFCQFPRPEIKYIESIQCKASYETNGHCQLVYFFNQFRVFGILYLKIAILYI